MKNYKMIQNILATLVFGILLTGCPSTRKGPPASVHYDNAASTYHVVKKGDSIASIAQKHGMNKRELISINSLESPYRIVKGQRLLVRPYRSSSAGNEVYDDETSANEDVGNVSDEDDVQVKPLAPTSGAGMVAKGFVTPESKMNPEINDESEGAETQPQRGDEDYIDEAESLKAQARNPDRSSMSEVPAASNVYTWPIEGKVIRDFNPSGTGKAQNDGINIAAQKGAPVFAANNGEVAYAGNQLRGFGKVVLVKHDNNTMTVYAHLDKVSVQKKDIVSAGQELGTVGQTGAVKEPQLHFEIRKGRTPIDPSKYLGRSKGSNNGNAAAA